MSGKAIIDVKDLGIFFNRFHKRDSARTWLRSCVSPKFAKRRRFWALKDVGFEVCQGDVLGVVGRNGAGKSTLLKLLAGVYQPDEGQITIEGKISPVMAIGKGLSTNLTGRDNFFLVGSMIGLPQKRLHEIFDEAIEFAGPQVQEFIDTPVKTYSAGMRARLSFTISVYARPDVLLIDEMLGAGDKDFRAKAQAKMKEMTNSSKATVIVSHNIDALHEYCNKILWLESGKVHRYGEAEPILEEFMK